MQPNTAPTETSITLCDTDINLRQRSPGIQGTTWGAMRYRHTIEIIIVDEWPETFEYYGSAHDYQAGKDVLTETDLLTAFECVIGDAIAGTYDCKEFFAEFEYDDPCEGIKTWKGCVKTFEMLNGMGISEDMLYDMINEIGDITSRSD